jgi:hypothetical protein
MGPSVVADLKAEHDALMGHLLENEPSLAVSTGQILSKSLLLAGASELEVDITRIILEFFEEVASGNTTALGFVEHKAMQRQFHTLFGWDGTNANSFFALFGPEFKQYAVEIVRNDQELSGAIVGFLRLGSLRNQLVHGNFAAFSLSQTADEIYGLYETACAFREFLPRLLRKAHIATAN